MPKFQLTSPDGKKYEVEGPEGATPEQAYDILQKQLGAQSGNTQGGDLARGLLHGAMSSVPILSSYAGKEPEGASAWRETGEQIGSVIPPTIAGAVVPEAVIGKGALGAVTGAFQPAKDWKERAENVGLGALSAYGGGKLAHSPGVKTALDKLSEMGLGYLTGGHLGGGLGGYGGLWAGPYVGRQFERMFGGGLGDLVGWLAKNPGLAAAMGVKLRPAVEQAGNYMGEELGKPSQ